MMYEKKRINSKLISPVQFTLLILGLLTASKSIAQVDSSKWMITIEASVQEHDKRLYSLPDQARKLAAHPERFGTYLVGMYVSRRIVSHNRLSLFAGIGTQLQMSTFPRPFMLDHPPETQISFNIYYTDRYYEGMLVPLLRLEYEVLPSLSIWSSFRPRYRFVVEAGRYSGNGSSGKVWDFEAKSYEGNVGLRYVFSQYDISLGVRVYNLHKIDKYTVNRITHRVSDGEIIPRGFENHNPLRLTLGFSRYF